MLALLVYLVAACILRRRRLMYRRAVGKARSPYEKLVYGKRYDCMARIASMSEANVPHSLSSFFFRCLVAIAVRFLLAVTSWSAWSWGTST